jgi:hypothetical protein
MDSWWTSSHIGFQNQMLAATSIMESQLHSSLHAEGHGSWRTNEELFSHGSDQSPPGCINFSPAWFQQAHEVSAAWI